MPPARNLGEVLGGLTILALVATIVGSPIIAKQLEKLLTGFAALINAAKGN